LIDRECTALLRTGLVSATTDRRQRLLVVAEERATTYPGNAGYQRDLAVSHNKLGDLARAAGDNTTADQHYRAALHHPRTPRRHRPRQRPMIVAVGGDLRTPDLEGSGDRSCSRHRVAQPLWTTG